MIEEKDLVRLREFIRTRLALKDDLAPFSDTESLFSSARLDSLDAVEMIVFLEENFQVDFSAIGFDQTLIDSVTATAELFAV